MAQAVSLQTCAARSRATGHRDYTVTCPLTGASRPPQVHSYKGYDLAVEHWERPPPIPWPVSRLCPAGGYRRQQNLYRWVGHRVRAGDRMPNVTLPTQGGGEQKLYPYSAGWMLLLLEGQPAENAAQASRLCPPKPKPDPELQP